MQWKQHINQNQTDQSQTESKTISKIKYSASFYKTVSNAWLKTKIYKNYQKSWLYMCSRAKLNFWLLEIKTKLETVQWPVTKIGRIWRSVYTATTEGKNIKTEMPGTKLFEGTVWVMLFVLKIVEFSILMNKILKTEDATNSSDNLACGYGKELKRFLSWVLKLKNLFENHYQIPKIGHIVCISIKLLLVGNECNSSDLIS